MLYASLATISPTCFHPKYLITCAIFGPAFIVNAFIFFYLFYYLYLYFVPAASSAGMVRKKVGNCVLSESSVAVDWPEIWGI